MVKMCTARPHPTSTAPSSRHYFLLTGDLSRVTGENVGGYAINAGTLSAGSNYTISLAANNAALTITPATLTVTADSETKTYGQDDPTLTYSASRHQFSDTDAVLSGSLSRAAGENVGSYAINAGTLSAGSNYTISLAANNAALTITPATLTVTADSETKTYGQDDPTLTYSASGYQFSDTDAVFMVV